MKSNVSRLVVVAALLVLPMPALAAGGNRPAAPGNKPAMERVVKNDRPADKKEAKKNARPGNKPMAKSAPRAERRLALPEPPPRPGKLVSYSLLRQNGWW